MPQNFTVPQFVDVESKVIGAITARQFIILLAGAILMGICYKLFSFWVFIFISVFIFAITGSFAFVKINGRPFHFFVLNFIQTSKRTSMRVWNNQNSTKDQEDPEVEKVNKEKKTPPKKALSKSRLSELSLVVDTKGVYKEGVKKQNNEDK